MTFILITDSFINNQYFICEYPININASLIFHIRIDFFTLALGRFFFFARYYSTWFIYLFSSFFQLLAVNKRVILAVVLILAFVVIQLIYFYFVPLFKFSFLIFVMCQFFVLLDFLLHYNRLRLNYGSLWTTVYSLSSVLVKNLTYSRKLFYFGDVEDILYISIEIYQYQDCDN
jgi:hypothetical protein